MTVVVDTNVLIDHLRAHEPARTLIAAAVRESQPLLASTISKVEVLAGMRSVERAATRRLFELVDWISVSDDVAERAGELARQFARTHRGVGLADFVVAATAQDNDARLWTRNVRHFPMFPDLEAPY